jgi:hypothetical protein
MPSSLDRKGLRMFIEDKVKRFGLPVIVWFFGVGPLMIFLIDYAYGLSSAYHWNPVDGPEWFIVWLLAFSIMYALLAQYSSCPRWMKLPGACGLFALGFVLGFVQFAVSAYFRLYDGKFSVVILSGSIGQTPFYVAFFVAGIAAKRNGWLDELANFSSCSLWALRSLVVILAAVIIFYGPKWQGLLAEYANEDTSMEQSSNFWLVLFSWEVVQCMFGVVVSVVEVNLFRCWFNYGGGRIQRFFTESMYGAFLFHYPFVHFFAWTYARLILEQGLGIELDYKIIPWCFMRINCPGDVFSVTNDAYILQVSVSAATPLDEIHAWLGWAYTTVLTLLVVFPLSYFLRKLPILRDIL